MSVNYIVYIKGGYFMQVKIEDLINEALATRDKLTDKDILEIRQLLMEYRKLKADNIYKYKDFPMKYDRERISIEVMNDILKKFNIEKIPLK